MKQTLFIISFSGFNSIFAENLTESEINQIENIKSKMSDDEYAGYSPEEQNKRNNIQLIVGSKELFPTTI